LISHGLALGAFSPERSLAISMVQTCFYAVPISVVCLTPLLFACFHPADITTVTMSAIAALADVKDRFAPSTSPLAYNQIVWLAHRSYDGIGQNLSMVGK